MSIAKKLTKPQPKRRNKASYLIPRLITISVLVAVLAIGAFPGYLKWQWRWRDVGEVNLSQVLEIREQGIEIPGWKLIDQNTLKINRHEWSGQIFQTPNNQAVTILIKPQPYYKDKPEVEWVDLSGFMKWRTDSYRTLKLTIPGKDNQKSYEVKARYFRGWTPIETFAVLQWYSWTNGGSFQAKHWFIQDQIAQIFAKRQPWAAVVAFLKVEPLSDIEKVASQAESIGVEIQTALNQILLKTTETVN